MSRQIEIRVGPRCSHDAGAREQIFNGAGLVIAERCAGCHRIVQIRRCAGCKRTFRASDSNLKHGKLYHSIRCRRKAARLRKKVREMQPETDLSRKKFLNRSERSL